ncbi:MAG TPA: glycosyltransferase family 2 protein [Terriglobales bacterium]|nr:glycosyltransferase family 2 protein [Terriglobales bacterium]
MKAAESEERQPAQPEVSVIVPARNEEACLGRCLESLVRQEGVEFEVLVVDDGSTDRTREIAAGFGDVRLLEADPLPSGWSGKSNALATGVRQARGRWLLFTDADTVHRPGSLRRALHEAQEHGAALLSYSPEQEVQGFWERALMPVVFAELAATYRPKEVSDPKSEDAAANGQYLLIAREAYDAVGGHTAVSGTLLEDVALARAVKKAGFRLRFRYGGDAVRTRMYRTLGQMWEGWTKNLAALFPNPLWLAATRTLEFLALAGGALASIRLVPRFAEGWLALAATAALWLNFALRIRRAHFPWLANGVAAAGLPIFALLLANSFIHYKLRRNVTWKGRHYSVPGGEEGLQPGVAHKRHGLSDA